MVPTIIGGAERATEVKGQGFLVHYCAKNEETWVFQGDIDVEKSSHPKSNTNFGWSTKLPFFLVVSVCIIVTSFSFILICFKNYP
jgi:hypothetical protein